MMEEVSMVVAYDAHVFGQLRDEDLLASLVAGSKPKAVVGVPPLPVMLKGYYSVPFFVLHFLSFDLVSILLLFQKFAVIHQQNEIKLFQMRLLKSLS